MNLKSFMDRHLKGPGGALELIDIAAPLVMTFACETVMMFTDRLFLSRLSGAHMAAAMGGGITAFTSMTFFMGVIGYANAMVAQRFGAGKKEFCPVVVTQSVIIAILAYPLLIGSIPLGYRIFEFAHLSPRQLVEQHTYYTWLMFGTISALLRSAIGSFFSGIGRTGIQMIAAITSMVLNVGLNYMLIFGKYGMPAFGIKGAAIGTLIAGLAGLGVLVGAYLQPALVREFSILNSLRFDRRLMSELLRLGYPAGLEMLLNLVAFSTMVTVFHSCGEAIATAITITFNWDMVAFVPMIGVNIAVTSLAGRYYGAKDRAAIYRAAYSGLKLAGLYCGLLMVPFLFLTGPLVDMFLPEGSVALPQIREMAFFMVRFIALYLFCDAVLQVFAGALRGVGDTFWSMVVSVSMHWTIALIAFVMLKKLHFDAKHAWLTVIAVFMFFGPVYYLRFRSGRWERRVPEA